MTTHAERLEAARRAWDDAADGEVVQDIVAAYLGDDEVYVRTSKPEVGLPPDGVVHDGEGNWLVPLNREGIVKRDTKCFTCGEGQPKDECQHSQRPCGHHCNCSWTQDICHWCGEEFGEDTG